jgi:drug/metabolite transporter (DMT)-like permease
MDLYTLSLAMTVAGNAGYHLLNKSVAPAAHPFASLVATYGVGFVVALAALTFDRRRGIVAEWRELNWASYLLGVVVVSLELGFLLAYRAGWQVSIAAVYSNVAVGVLLIPIGVLLYRETLTVNQGAGIVLAVAGLVLMSR